MSREIPLDPANQADVLLPESSSEADAGIHEIAVDVAYRRLAIVNVVFVGVPAPDKGSWVLVDAGVPGTAGMIARAAEARFGHARPPAAIVMTHGHFDHVGALETLAEQWDVPIYAHPLELPYLDGTASYPPPDPTVGGGLMATLSPMYPRAPVNVRRWLKPLPEDGTVPGMPGWSWVHTPGHTPGHVSFWRESDRTMIVGDAFVTTRQESAYAVALQTPEMHGPPMYFTQDWEAARDSVRRLAALNPDVVVTGHGRAMRGGEMLAALRMLARDFDTIAVPHAGRYVEHPARAEDGSAYREP